MEWLSDSHHANMSYISCKVDYYAGICLASFTLDPKGGTGAEGHIIGTQEQSWRGICLF